MCIPCHRTYDLGRITFEQRQEIRDRVAAGESYQDLAREFGISPSVIRHGLDPRTRKWISPL
jgi:transposase-like protein